MWKPRVVVASVIERQGKFLVVEEEIDGQRVYSQPAGHLEANESLIEAVKRETLEETGWLFEPTALLGVMHLLNPDTRRIFIRFAFTGDLIEHLPNYSIDPDILNVLWMSYDEIMQKAPQFWRSPLVKSSLDSYRNGTRYPLDLVSTLQIETCQKNTSLLEYQEA